MTYWLNDIDGSAITNATEMEEYVATYKQEEYRKWKLLLYDPLNY